MVQALGLNGDSGVGRDLLPGWQDAFVIIRRIRGKLYEERNGKGA